MFWQFFAAQMFFFRVYCRAREGSLTFAYSISLASLLLTLSLLPVSRAAAAATCEEDEAEQDSLPPGTAATCAPTAAVFAAVFAAADQRPRSGKARL
jgi:hypothetical protein